MIFISINKKNTMNEKIKNLLDSIMIILVTILLCQILIYGQINRNIDKIINEKYKTEYVKR